MNNNQQGCQKHWIKDCPLCRPIQVPTHKITEVPDALAGFVRILMPKPLQITPKSKRALVTVASGAKTEELFAISRPLMEAYARKHNLDFVVLSEPGPASWPMGAKFAIPRALELYERIFFVDADVILRPSVPDVFEMCQQQELALWSDLADVLAKGGGFTDEFIQWRLKVGLSNAPPFRLPYYWNTGVFVASREHHLRFFHLPKQPIPIAHCSEQHWWVSSFLDGGALVKNMPRSFNWQWWADPGFVAREVPDDAIMHISGMGDHELRKQVMKEWANKPPKKVTVPVSTEWTKYEGTAPFSWRD